MSIAPYRHACAVCSLLQQLAELHPCTALGERADPAERYVTVSTHAWSATDRQAAHLFLSRHRVCVCTHCVPWQEMRRRCPKVLCTSLHLMPWSKCVFCCCLMATDYCFCNAAAMQQTGHANAQPAPGPDRRDRRRGGRRRRQRWQRPAARPGHPVAAGGAAAGPDARAGRPRGALRAWRAPAQAPPAQRAHLRQALRPCDLHGCYKLMPGSKRGDV